MRSGALTLLLGFCLFDPQPDGSMMRARVELELDETRSVAISYQTLPSTKLAERPPKVGPEEANWRLFAVPFGGEFATKVRLKAGDQEFGPGKFGFYVQPRDEGGMRLVVLDGQQSRPIALELTRAPIEQRYLTLSLTPSDLATFELTVSWGKDVGRVRFWTP